MNEDINPASTTDLATFDLDWVISPVLVDVIMSGRRRAAAARVSYNPSEGDSEQREERRSKAMAQLVYLGMAKLDDIAATDDRKSGPFKPGQVAEACFMVAPDGKFKGMRFRKAELMQSLRVLGVPPTTEASKDGEQQIFSVAPMTKSGQVRYSSYPIDTSTLQEGNRKRGDDAYGPNPDIICGIRVPSQRVLWPSWPDQRAIDLQKTVSERKALDDVEREKEQVSACMTSFRPYVAFVTSPWVENYIPSLS
jgi:hypothetical protein